MVNIHILGEIIIGQGESGDTKYIGEKDKKQSADQEIQAFVHGPRVNDNKPSKESQQFKAITTILDLDAPITNHTNKTSCRFDLPPQ